MCARAFVPGQCNRSVRVTKLSNFLLSLIEHTPQAAAVAAKASVTASSEPNLNGSCPHGVKLQKTVWSLFSKAKIVPTGKTCIICEDDIKASKAEAAAAESNVREVCGLLPRPPSCINHLIHSKYGSSVFAQEFIFSYRVRCTCDLKCF